MIYSIYTDYRDSEIRGYIQTPTPRSFARAAQEIVDVWARPLKGLKGLSAEVKDKFRATQITQTDPTVEVLSPPFEGWVLVRLWEGTIGWTQEAELEMLPSRVVPHEPLISLEQFLERYRGTPYLRGGTTIKGIDCSGLVQRYFAQVMGKTLPRHSTNQWAAGDRAEPEALQEGDLLNLRKRDGSTDHVGIWLSGDRVLHACLDHKGVVVEPRGDLKERYDLFGITHIR